MKRLIVLLKIYLCFFVVQLQASEAGEKPRNALSFVIKNKYASNKTFYCALHSQGSKLNFPKGKPHAVQFSQNGKCVFRNLAPGKYAFLAFLDKNANKKIDLHLLGYPLEPWGVSGKRPRFKAPSFLSSAIQYSGLTEEFMVKIY